MIQLDEQLLSDLGLRDLPAAHKDVILRAIYSELEIRVGGIIAGQMSSHQIDEFEVFVEATDDPGAFSWLQSNFPDYKSVVRDEFNKLRAEISDNRDAVTALSALYPPNLG